VALQPELGLRTRRVVEVAVPLAVIVTVLVPDGSVRIPAMPITNSNLMAIMIPIDADHHRSEATLGCTYHRQRLDRESISSLRRGE